MAGAIISPLPPTLDTELLVYSLVGVRDKLSRSPNSTPLGCEKWLGHYLSLGNFFYRSPVDLRACPIGELYLFLGESGRVSSNTLYSLSCTGELRVYGQGHVHKIPSDDYVALVLHTVRSIYPGSAYNLLTLLYKS